MIKFKSYMPKKLSDNLVAKTVYLVQIRIGDYLNLVNLEENPFQRNVLESKIYEKLIKDILRGALFPPISVIYNKKIDLTQGLDENSKVLILDGLQRTNCLFVCKDMLEGKTKERFPSIYQDVNDFLDREIILEIWEELGLRAILYKTIVLNTGQKRMDTRHQLDIMVSSLKGFLNENKINYIELKEQIEEDLSKKEFEKENKFPLFTIAEGIAAYVTRYPQLTQKNTTQFLFEKLDLEPEDYENSIKIIEDEGTYEDLIWVLRDFSKLLLSKYNYNVLIRYSLFLSSFLAAMGYVRADFGNKIIEKKKETLINSLKSDNKDPLDLANYLRYYEEFTSGIGTKRRKLVYIAFKNFLASPVSEKIDWYQAFKEVK